MVAIPHPMGSLEAFQGSRPRRSRQTSPDSWQNPAPQPTMGEARGRASFIVIIGLESPPVLIGMDIMRPLRVRIDVTNGTATPAQPDHKPFISTPPKHRTFPPQAALCCYKPSTSPPKQSAWSVAITHGRLYNWPAPASARIPQPDLVETTSPGLTSPSTAHSDLIETASLGRPVGQ